MNSFLLAGDSESCALIIVKEVVILFLLARENERISLIKMVLYFLEILLTFFLILIDMRIEDLVTVLDSTLVKILVILFIEFALMT